MRESTFVIFKEQALKKKYIDINEYAGVITKELERGVLLTTKYGDKVNSMVIGWGHIGRIIKEQP